MYLSINLDFVYSIVRSKILFVRVSFYGCISTTWRRQCGVTSTRRGEIPLSTLNKRDHFETSIIHPTQWQTLGNGHQEYSVSLFRILRRHTPSDVPRPIRYAE